MTEMEIVDPAQARTLVLQGLCLSRAVRLTPSRLKSALNWALALVAEGLPLPPIGFVADLGNIALGIDRDLRQAPPAFTNKSWDAILRTYEDHVLGKVFSDRTLDRASDVLRKLSVRDQARGLAFVMDKFQARAGFVGMHLSPAVIKALLEIPGEEVSARAWATLNAGDVDPILEEMYHQLITTVRQSAEMLGTEDLFELEHGTALADFSQRVALRQVVRAVELISTGVSKRPPPGAPQRQEVPTRLMDEDAYPVGGFASISNRGSVESLLHSQLALMEPDVAHRPDMFDVKFLRDELLYYSRDENQFLRQRRLFHIGFDESLAAARFKDPHAPFQRIILALAAVIAIIRIARDWLDRDELTFVLTFPDILLEEMTIAKMVLRDDIGMQSVKVISSPRAERRTNRSTNHSSDDLEVTAIPGIKTPSKRIDVSMPIPTTHLPETAEVPVPTDDVLEIWSRIVTHMLIDWI